MALAKVETKMVLGEMVFKFKGNEDKVMETFPQLEVTGEKYNKEHTYYLSPFRGYGFQVSGGPNGEGSFGTSEFVGLKNIVKGLDKNVAQAILYGMALNALHDHSRHYNESWYPSFEEKQKLDKFATASYDWVSDWMDQERLNRVETRLPKEEKTFFGKIKSKLTK
jgi:hypothetical protein